MCLCIICICLSPRQLLICMYICQLHEVCSYSSFLAGRSTLPGNLLSYLHIHISTPSYFILMYWEIDVPIQTENKFEKASLADRVTALPGKLLNCLHIHISTPSYFILMYWDWCANSNWKFEKAFPCWSCHLSSKLPNRIWSLCRHSQK